MLKRVLVVLGALMPMVAQADPNPTVKYLMNTPPSLLDFGLYQAERYLERDIARLKNEPDLAYRNARTKYGRGYAEYEFDKNRIVYLLTVVYIDDEICKVAFEDFKRFPGMASERFFDHNGYSPSGRPGNVKAELDKISVFVITGNAFGYEERDDPYCHFKAGDKAYTMTTSKKK